MKSDRHRDESNAGVGAGANGHRLCWSRAVKGGRTGRMLYVGSMKIYKMKTYGKMNPRLFRVSSLGKC